jgi:hypothetical protein
MRATATIDSDDATRMTVVLTWEFVEALDGVDSEFIRVDWGDGSAWEGVAEGTFTATHVYDPDTTGYYNQWKDIVLYGNDRRFKLRVLVGEAKPDLYDTYPPDPNRGFQQSTWDAAMIDAEEVLTLPSGDLPPGRGNEGLVNPGR